MTEGTYALSLIREWLGYLDASRGRNSRTIRMYRRIMVSFVVECVQDRPFDAVTTSSIERWLQRPREGRAQGRTAAPATQHRDASCVRGFYTWLQASGEIARNPAQLVATPTVRNRQPRPVSDVVWQQLWAGAEGIDAIVLGLMFFAGLRREEVTRLRAHHVDIGARRLCNFVRKGGGEDVLPVGTMVEVFETRLPHLGAERLMPLIEKRAAQVAGDAFLVGWADLGRPRDSVAASFREPGQLAPQHLNRWLDRRCDQAHVVHVHPHQLRHSFGTNLIRAGIPLPIVSTLMAHTNVHTTMRYVKAGGDELGEWLRRSS